MRGQTCRTLTGHEHKPAALNVHRSNSGQFFLYRPAMPAFRGKLLFTVGNTSPENNRAILMTKESFNLNEVLNADGAVILDTKNGKISTLNSTGALIWQALRRGDSEDAIISRLAMDTGEERETIDRDVREFINTLKEKQLSVR